MPVFQEDFVNHMGLLTACGNKRIEKCFSQTRQTWSNSVSLQSVRLRIFFFSFSWFSSSYNYINIFCFVLFLFEAKIFFAGILRFLFHWAIFIVIIQSYSEPYGCSGNFITPEDALQFLAKKMETLFQNIDHLRRIV